MKRIKTYKIFESTESVESICKKYGIKNWSLNPDVTIDVDGDVNLSDRGLGELPLKFGRVTGYFSCSGNNLTILFGSPDWVGCDFRCSNNNLTSLEYCTNLIDGSFSCSDNKLTSLEGSPNRVGGDFSCIENNLTNLEWSPSFVDGNFDCSFNELINLEGCPEKIYGNLYCESNNIISLDHYPTILSGRLFTYDNPIFEIWKHVIDNKDKNHGVLLELFWLNNPVRFEGGQWVCYREFLDNFFEEIGVPSPPKLKNYKEV